MAHEKYNGCPCQSNNDRSTHFGNYSLHDAMSEIRGSDEQKVLLKGMNLLPCYHGFQASQLEINVQIALRSSRIKSMTAVQTCSWPHIMGGRNTIIVTTELDELKKCTSYLAPVASKAVQNLELVKHARGYGPFAVILCASNDDARVITKLLEKLVDSRLGIYQGYYPDPEIKAKLKLRPDFVICEPDFFNYVKTNYPDYFVLKRLKFFIIDDCFGTFNHDFEHTNEAIQTVIREVLRSGKGRAWSLQTIFCSRVWVDKMYDAYEDLFPRPVQVMESFVRQGVGHIETNQRTELNEPVEEVEEGENQDKPIPEIAEAPTVLKPHGLDITAASESAPQTKSADNPKINAPASLSRPRRMTTRISWK